MTKPVAIAGAGLSGLIAANLFRSRGYQIRVYELQPNLPDNHNALLRFRSPALGEALGIPFKKVTAVICLYHPSAASSALRVATDYAYATTGKRRSDRSITRLLDGPLIVDRWVAPVDFRERLFDRIKDKVVFDKKISLIGHAESDEHLVSTIPMKDAFAEWADKTILPECFKIPVFSAHEYIAGTVSLLNYEAYGTIYNPEPTAEVPWTRASVTGSTTHFEISLQWDKEGLLKNLESLKELVSVMAQSLFNADIDYTKGAPVTYHSRADRILPIDDRVRKSFIMELTDEHNVYSLGRFATWRPGMLLDDLPKDVAVISGMIEGGTGIRYEASK